MSGFPGNQNAELVASPGILSGAVTVKSTNELWGIEENLRYPMCCGCNWKVDFLAGVRYMQLDEGLIIAENLNIVQPTGWSVWGSRRSRNCVWDCCRRAWLAS